MSTLTADPGFGRGQVLGILWKAYDAENGDGSQVLGVRKTFLDENPVSKQTLSNRTVDCICVKNTSGSALLPKTVVKFAAGSLTSVDGAADNTSILIGVVDEYLPAAGVAAGEVFWLAVSGPSEALKTSGAGTAITAGALVAASSTAGKIAAGTSPQLGTALAAAATGDTSVRVLLKTNAA